MNNMNKLLLCMALVPVYCTIQAHNFGGQNWQGNQQETSVATPTTTNTASETNTNSSALTTANAGPETTAPETIGNSAASTATNIVSGTTLNTTSGATGNYTHNHNYNSSQTNPQSIITTIESIFSVVEAVSSFISTIIPPASNTTTATASSRVEPRKLSDDDVKKIQNAHDFLKASLLKIFEDEEKI